MHALPTGTVSFCFTDIEGSTRLFSRLGDRYEALLAEHRRMIRAATAGCSGAEIKTEGDGCFLAFQDVTSAVKAAGEIQRALGTHPWPTDAVIRVRIGVHTGEARPSGHDYVALAVHQAARVADAGHGGQVIVSEETASHLADHDFAPFTLVELGAYRLRSFEAPCRLYQLTGPGLDSRFPQLRANTAALDRVLVTRSKLVGRGGELSDLRHRLEQALSGRGGMVLLGGEPGVGKTRLAEDVGAEAAAQGALVLTGHCVEAESAAPYAPFVELLEQTARFVDPARFRTALGDDAAQVAKIYPDLRKQFADIPSPIELPDEQERRYLFNSVRDYLERACRLHPLVLVLDDLHWADEATLALLRHVAERLRGLPILVLGTYRDVGLDITPAFASTLEDILRRRLGERLAIRRLGASDITELITAIVGQTIPAAFAAAVHNATEGNPFFVEEVVKHLAEEGRLLDAAGRLRVDVAITDLDVPAGVRLVVSRRLQRLSETSRKGLTAAAVVGRRFDAHLLERLDVGDADEVLDILEEAEGAGLIGSGPAGYSFAHDLIRATLLAELSLPRRQRMHLRVADAMERHSASKLEERAADLAHHLSSAGANADPERTVRYLAIAGSRALDAVAFEEALVHFERALSIAPDAPTATRAEILQGHGRCCLSLGRWDEAVAELQKAFDIYETIGDADAVGRLAPNLAYLFTFASRYMEGMQVLRRGLAALGDRRTPERGRLLSQLGMMTSAAGFREIGDPMLDEARTLARDLGDPKLLAQVAQSMTFRHYCVSEWRETVKYGQEAERLSHQTGDHYNTMNSTLLTVSSFAVMARFDEAEKMLASAEETAKRVGNFGAWVGLQAAHLSMAPARGEPPHAFEDLAKDLLEHHRDRPQLPSVAFGAVWMALAAYWLGRWDEAAKYWTEGARVSTYGAPGLMEGLGWGAALAGRARIGDRAGAEAMLKEHPAALEPPSDSAVLRPGAWNRLASTAEALVLLDRGEEARRFTPLLHECLDRGSVLRWSNSGLFHTVLAMVAATGDDAEEADRHFKAALDLAERLGHRIEEAEIRRVWGDALLERGDGKRARPLFDAAATRYERLRMPRHVDLVRARLARV